MAGDPLQVPCGGPACPRCGASMVQRRRRQDGAAFWGCPEFPRCHGARPIDLAEGAGHQAPSANLAGPAAIDNPDWRRPSGAGASARAEDDRERRDARRTWRQAVDLLSTDVRGETEARTELERRYSSAKGPSRRCR